MIPKYHCASTFSTPTEERFHCNIVSVSASHSKLCSFLAKSQTFQQADLSTKKAGLSIWITYLAKKSVESFHRGCLMFDGVLNASELSTNVLNAVRRPKSFSVELLRTLFD